MRSSAPLPADALDQRPAVRNSFQPRQSLADVTGLSTVGLAAALSSPRIAVNFR